MRRVIAAVVLVLLWPHVAFAGKLGDMREETGSSDERSNGSSASYDDDDDCGLLEAILTDCDEVASSVVPMTPSSSALVGPGTSNVSSASRSPIFFPLYPYRGRARGNLLRRHYSIDLFETWCAPTDRACHDVYRVSTCIDSVCFSPILPSEQPEERSLRADDGDQHDASAMALPETSGSVDRVQSARLQLKLDLGQDRDGLYRATLGGSIDGVQGFGLETRVTRWIEPLPEGTDGTWIGVLNLRYALLLLPAVQLRLGLGPRFQWDSSSKSAGVNVTAGIELYPVWPLVLRVDADVGNLGEALVLESQASVGVLLWRAELLAGVSTLHVGAVAFDSVFAGIRCHL
jgi:hypothetical protein